MADKSLVIGVDESGKGDFFGSLVIASFAAANDELSLLKALGVRDGKLIAEKKLIEIDKNLRADFNHSLVIFQPELYNKRYRQIKNLNILLAEGHASAIDALHKKVNADIAISDKFGKTHLIEDALTDRGCSIPLKQLVRGEAVIQVAAASILARAAFMREMDRLSEMVGFELPRGAAPKVDEAGRLLCREQGVEVFEKVAKLHFKNYYRVINPVLL